MAMAEEAGSREPEITDPHQALLELADQGYETVTFATGPWVEVDGFRMRITREWAARHPEGPISAITEKKFEDMGGHNRHAPFQLDRYGNADDYKTHVEKFELSVGPEEPIR